MTIRPAWLVLLVISSFFGVILVANAWELPSTRHQFEETGGETVEVQMLVDGLRCRGTANFFVNMLSPIDGLVSVDTYVQEHRAVLVYDPALITAEEIRRVIDAPVKLRDGRVVQPFRVRKVLD
jgi:hypothetical protein